MRMVLAILLIFALILSTSCDNKISTSAGNVKGEGYINVSIGDDTYHWLAYTGFISQTNTLVLAYYNGGMPYNHFVPVVNGEAKIADPTGGYILFSEIKIQPNGDMSAYIKTIRED